MTRLMPCVARAHVMRGRTFLGGVRVGVEQETAGGVPEMDGMLVVLDEKTENTKAGATSSDALIADGGNLEGDARVSCVAWSLEGISCIEFLGFWSEVHACCGFLVTYLS